MSCISRLMSRPSMMALPPEGSRKPTSMLMEVVFPAPFGPSRPKHSPRSMAMVRLRTARLGLPPSSPGYVLARSLITMGVLLTSVSPSTRALSAATSAISPPGPLTVREEWGGAAASRERRPEPMSCCFFLQHHSRKKRGWRLMPLPVEMTCSKYQPSSMNMGHSTRKMPHVASMPFLASLRSLNCMPGSLRYTPRKAYCPISNRPLYSDQAGTHSTKKHHSASVRMNVCSSSEPMRPDANT
mmetsp:Transcript_33634/g.74461  ORF Transcript_33634/g.74461 Transcript_33634/m.74461 type:complete len:242 (-) Transcript_33634:1758-2483(-)